MNIYAIRDRLIDYFMQPFVGPDDKNVLAAVARTVNQLEGTSDISQAPHQFEVWKLGQVTDEGHLVPQRELVADCASLVRPGIRTNTTTQRGGATADKEPGKGPADDRGNGPPGRAHSSPVPGQAPKPEGPTDEIRPATQGGYPPRDGHRHPST